ncbi:BAG domain-containing protein Samui [Eumeta japonica]|uniref:BAG domain-containing protein Samui n=1 Tax=Eumeta variegata TaxID=151549 RepID=A0A4C1X1D5_EUMVA|nr:BAG domain-containing protein Samui [Eumeta japonica]
MYRSRARAVVVHYRERLDTSAHAPWRRVRSSEAVPNNSPPPVSRRLLIWYYRLRSARPGRAGDTVFVSLFYGSLLVIGGDATMATRSYVDVATVTRADVRMHIGRPTAGTGSLKAQFTYTRHRVWARQSLRPRPLVVSSRLHRGVYVAVCPHYQDLRAYLPELRRRSGAASDGHDPECSVGSVRCPDDAHDAGSLYFSITCANVTVTALLLHTFLRVAYPTHAKNNLVRIAMTSASVAEIAVTDFFTAPRCRNQLNSNRDGFPTTTPARRSAVDAARRRRPTVYENETNVDETNRFIAFLSIPTVVLKLKNFNTNRLPVDSIAQSGGLSGKRSADGSYSATLPYMELISTTSAHRLDIEMVVLLQRGFPFDEEEGSSAWSELAARHPDVAARLRARPAAAAAWARKRRPASQEGVDDFGSSFEHFDRFPFDDIPPEFREHLPSHWNRRFGTRNDPPPQSQGPPPQAEPAPPSAPRAHQTAATQTDETLEAQHPADSLPQYGLRNTVDLGQRSPADPSLVDADDRNQRSMSAPPGNHLPEHNYASKMSGPNQHQPQNEQNAEHPPPSNVRHIPIFVEGRDEPVINKNVEHGPTYAAPSPPDREQYFADEAPPGFQHNFSRTFPTPFNRQAGFRQGPQPFVQQKVYPQNAFARANSPQRSQSPKPQMHPDEHYIKVPVHHEQPIPKKSEHVPSNKTQQQQKTPQQPHPQPQQQQQQQQMPRARTPPQPQQPPPPPQQPSPGNDPISVILNVQTDVLNLMTEVENFNGTKKDKKYLYLDEMLTRNLIKLDNIETDGKENVRQARKEAIKCIQKCIAVLEAKAESNMAAAQSQVAPSQPQHDVEMKENAANEATENKPSEPKENGEVVTKEVEMKDDTKESKLIENPKVEQPQSVTPEQNDEVKKEESVQSEQQPNGEKPQAQTDTRQNSQKIEVDDTTTQKAEETKPVENKDNNPNLTDNQITNNATQEENKTKSPKPAKKNVSKGGKKRDKSKDNKKETTNEKAEDSNVDSAKTEHVNVGEQGKSEPMQIDEKGDSKAANGGQAMEVEAAPTPSQ